MSPTTSPSGWAVNSNCMIRSRASFPMAENMSAYSATRVLVLAGEGLVAVTIFRYYWKYGPCQAETLRCSRVGLLWNIFVGDIVTPMKFVFWSVFFSIPLASMMAVSTSNSKQQNAEELFSRANRGTPDVAIKGPYRVQYKLTIHSATNGPIEGTYVSTRMSRHQWRREISISGYSDVSVADGQTLWIDRKPHLYEPEVIAHLNDSIEHTHEIKLGYHETVSKVKEETRDGIRIQCVEIRRNRPQSGEKLLCFDETTGALMRVRVGAERIEYSDFGEKNGAFMARRVRHFQGNDLDSEAELVSVTNLATPDPGLLNHSGESRPFSVCDVERLTPGKLISKTAPEYPIAARSAHQTGSVEIYGVIDLDGTVKDLEIIHGAAPILNSSALAAIRKWRYEPYRCDGSPVAVESMIAVAFTL